MANDLQSVLGYATITDLVKQQTDGIPKVLPDPFYNLTKPVKGRLSTYTRVPGTRNVAQICEYGAPSLRQEQKGISTVPVVLLHSYNHIILDPSVLIQLRAYESYAPMEGIGREEVARQSMSMSTRQLNLRTAAITSALSKGAIYFNDGNLLPSSSGATLTVDFAIAANNRNQLNGIIGASWATSTTDIPADIRELRERAAQLTGYPLRYAFYGRNIPSYLTQNDYVLDYLARNPGGNSKWVDSAELPPLFGLTWIPAYESFFEDSTGTVQSLFDPDQIVFTPEPSKDWYEVQEGSFAVPTSIDVAGEGAAAMGNLREVTGMGGYGRIIDDPPTAKIFYFDTFLPVIKVPNAVFIADVVP